MRPTAIAVCLLLSVIVVTVAGCATTRRLREARQAEWAGRYDRAYELYCEVAERRSSSRAVEAAIYRVSLLAARRWQDRAIVAATAGDYVRAWQCYMRALMIRPDHPRAAEKIRQLERDHPNVLAQARRQYQTRGPIVLAGAGQPPRRPPLEDRPPGRRIAQAEQQEQPESAARNNSEPAAQVAVAPSREATPQPDRQPPTTDSDDSSAEAAARQAVPRPDVAHRSASEHLFIGIVSRDDRRFPNKLEAIDGLFVKLRDTDPDPDADMEVYLGRKLVRKKKNWRVGQRLPVRGRSGRNYEVVILTIIDATETVRFAIRQGR